MSPKPIGWPSPNCCERCHGRFGNACCRLRESWSTCQRRSMSSISDSASACNCARCSGDIEFMSCCICAIDCAICSSSSSRRLGVAGEELAVAVHEAVEVGLLAAGTLLEHLVELGHHVLHRGHALGGEVLHALGHLVEVALHELLAQLVHQLLEPLACGVVHELVVLQRLHAPGEVGRQLGELALAQLGDVFEQLLATRVSGLLRVVDAPVDALALHVDDLVELPGDVVVHAAEVALLQLLAPALAELVEHLPQAHELLAVAVAHALLHEPTQRRVQIAVVEEVVGHLLEQGVGVEVEAALGSVPSGVLEPRAAGHPPRVPAPRPAGAWRCRVSGAA